MLRKLFEKRTTSDPIQRFTSGMPLGTSASSAGQTVSEETALNYATFFACVKILTEDLSTLPWQAQDVITGEQVAPPQILQSPSSYLTQQEWRETIAASFFTTGNAVCVKLRNDAGEVVELWPVATNAVRAGFNSQGGLFYEIHGKPYANADIWHVRFMAPPGGVLGRSPVSLLRDTIGLGVASQDFIANWHRDGIQPSMVFSTDQMLTAEQADEIEVQYIATNRGRRSPMVLSGGLKQETLTLSPGDAAVLDTRLFQKREIAAVMRVPPVLLADMTNGTSYAAVEQHELIYAKHSLTPPAIRIEHAFKSLLPPDIRLRHNMDGLLRADLQTRFRAYRSAVEMGILSRNEVRALENRKPVPGGDQFLAPLNLTPTQFLGLKESTPND